MRPAVISALVYVQDGKPIGAKTVDLEWSKKPDRLRKFRLPTLQNAAEVQRGLVVSFSINTRGNRFAKMLSSQTRSQGDVEVQASFPPRSKRCRPSPNSARLLLCSLFRSRVGPDAPGKFAQAACSYCPRQLDFPTTDGGHYVGDAIKKSVPRPACDRTVKPDDFDPKTIVHAACQDGN